MFPGGGEHDGPAFGVDLFGEFQALLLLVAEQFAEHLFDVIEGMGVAVPQQDVITRLAAGLPLVFFLFHRGNDRAPLVFGVRKSSHAVRLVCLSPTCGCPRWYKPGQRIILDAPGEGILPRCDSCLPTEYTYSLPASTVTATVPVNPALRQVLEFVDEHRQQFQEDLIELLRIPSVSADSAFRDDVRRAAQWLVEHLKQIGLSVELVETAGHPLVYAESPPVPGAPVVLVYGHYDVQPPDPLDQWTSPPFEPTVRDGNLYARGASDDKGQMLTHVKSLEAWLQASEQLPLQVKLLIEGEEEVGSEQLAAYLSQNVKILACDCVVISDTSQFAPGVPAITYGLRGIAYFELRLTGPNQDLHSGVFGGGVTNPANTLCQMLAAIIDERGCIQVPGFYDDVEPLTDEERAQWRSLPFDQAKFEKQLGVSGVTGEEGFSTLERRWARPAFDISGLTSGYQGEGAKTVLPARAAAKFSFRLVPNQDPHKIAARLRKFLEPLTPPGIRMELVEYHGGTGIAFPLESPYLHAASDAIEMGFGKRPVFMREGGSIPIVNQFAEQLGAEVLLVGWGQNDDNLHSPNEKFSLADFQRGIRASAALWDRLAAVHRG